MLFTSDRVRKCCSHPECGEIWPAAGNTNGEEESQLLVMGRAWPTQYVAASALALTNPEWFIAFLLLVDLTSAIVLLHTLSNTMEHKAQVYLDNLDRVPI